RLQYFPILAGVAGQRLERGGFARVQQRPVLGHRGIHVGARFKQAVAMPFRLSALRLEQIIPHVRSGNVEAGTDPFEDASAALEFLADLVVRRLYPHEGLASIELSEGHQKQQAAESDHQNSGSGLRGHFHGLLPSYRRTESLTPQRELTTGKRRQIRLKHCGLARQRAERRAARRSEVLSRALRLASADREPGRNGLPPLVRGAVCAHLSSLSGRPHR